METLFLKLVNMSITASWLVLAIVAVRLIFKKAPKWILCLLWGLVAVRLICPFSIESSLSLIPDPEPLSHEQVYITETVKQAHGEILDSEGNVIVERHPAVNGDILNSEGNIIVDVQDGHRTYPEEQAHGRTYTISRIWVIGFCVMLTYTAVSYYLLKKKVATAIPLKRGIKQSEYVDSPFVLGIIRPVIYLPFSMEEGDMTYVIAHEKAHIRRRDHWWKPFGFILLSIYWFNPVLWVAYIMLCRDIEAACDEKVIKDMMLDDRRAYSTALLNCSIHRRSIAACPLAFGETGVKSRVTGIINYRKPAFWVILIALVTCIIISVCFLTDPSGMHLYEIDDSRNYSDLFTNTDDITLIQKGEEHSVAYPENLLSILDDVTVRKQPLDRSRDENRDKTNRIHLQKNTYLNFSHNFKQVWIDNGLKPTYTYRVNEPKAVRAIFEIICGEKLTVTATEVTSAGLTAVYSPKQIYNRKDLLFHGNYWLERANGREWVKVDMLPEVGVGKISVSMDIKNNELHDLNWSVVYGTLSKGTYRIGVTFTFENILDGQSLTHDLYGEFTVEDNRNVIPWFDEDYNSGLTYRRSAGTITIPGTEVKLLFRDQFKDNLDQDQLQVQTEDGYKTVISGTEIRNVYLTDLTGDGIMEVCATVWAYHPVYNCHIAVYDYSEDKVCTLENPGQLMYELTCRNDTLIATMKKEYIGSILKMGTLELIRDSSADGYAFQITSLDDSFRDVTETITCIDLYTRKSVCLSSPEEIETMTTMLHNLQDMVVPVSASELEPVLADDFNWSFLNVNYDLGRKQLRFSTDFQYIWEEGVDGAYRIREPEALRSYVESITDGVRNRETSGAPFATMDTPWDWCAGLTSDAVASANMNVKLYTVGSSSSSTGGAISSSTLEELISVLNQIPRSAFKNEQSNTQRDYLDLTHTVGQTGVSVTLMDTVNQILVAIRTNGSRIEFLATNDLEKTEDRFRGYFFESLKMWTVDDSRLAELLTAYFENPPVITYTVGAEYDWQLPVQFGAEDFSLSLRLVEGWEYEEYSDRRSSGIRCRPAGVEEGWMYFSFWPGRYEPKEENRYISEWSWNDYPCETSWPSDVESPEGFSTYGHIWSYQKYVMNSGDFAIINDDADSWFLEYQDQIEDAITLSTFDEE